MIDYLAIIDEKFSNDEFRIIRKILDKFYSENPHCILDRLLYVNKFNTRGSFGSYYSCRNSIDIHPRISIRNFYRITHKKKKYPVNLITVMAHELCHMKQFTEKRLLDMPNRNGGYIFEEQYYRDWKYSFDLPWEKEALEYQMKFYNEFKEEYKE